MSPKLLVLKPFSYISNSFGIEYRIPPGILFDIQLGANLILFVGMLK